MRPWRRERPPRVDWTGWQPPDPVVSDIRKYMRRHRRANVGAYILVVLVFAYGFYDASRSREQACRAGNDTRAALRTIIVRGDRNLLKLEAEGTLSAAQVQRSLVASRSAQRRLAAVDCSSQ